MYLKKTRRGNRTYLAVMESYREGGRTRSRTVESLGYADDLAREHDDPVAYAEQRVAQLNEARRKGEAPVSFSVGRDERIASGGGNAVQLGEAIALAYLDAFDAAAFWSRVRSGADAIAAAPEAPDSNPALGIGRTFELLCAARMLHAVPVHETWATRDKFPRRCDMGFADVYRALPAFARHAPDYVAHLNRRYELLRGRRGLDNVRLVLSNYVFRVPEGAQGEANGPDELFGRRWGRLCLAIDGRGIPLTYRLVPRDLTCDQVLRLADDLKAEMGAQRVTLVAAQVPHAEQLARGMVEGGNGFVLLVDAHSAPEQMGAWMARDEGYSLTRKGAYRIKSRIASTRLTEGRRAGSTIEYKQIALTSAAGGNEEAFCIMSSEMGSSENAIFNIYRELWRVHEPFQVVSADFISKPYPVDALVQLRAHFLVCYTAFFALRVLREDMGWHYNAAQVADALLSLEGVYLDRGWYLFTYRSPVTDAVQEAAGMDVGRRLMSAGDIRHAIAQMRRNVEGRRACER